MNFVGARSTLAEAQREQLRMESSLLQTHSREGFGPTVLTPYSEHVRFETQQGLGLLYEPSHLDKWIGKPIRRNWRTWGYHDLTTRQPLSPEDTEDYKRYIRRHNERRETARRAHRLTDLVRRHNPRIENELRVYIMKFPWRVADLLSSAATTGTPEAHQVHPA